MTKSSKRFEEGACGGNVSCAAPITRKTLKNAIWLLAIKYFLYRIFCHLSTLNIEVAHYTFEENVPANSWTTLWRSCLHMFDVRFLQGAECPEYHVALQKLAIQRNSESTVVLIAIAFGFTGIIGSYFETIVYLDDMKQRQVKKTYGDGIMAVDTNATAVWAIALSETVQNCFGMKRNIWIDRVPFNCMKYISGGRYFSCVRSIASKRTPKNDVLFVQMISQQKATELSKLGAIPRKACWNKDAKEELHRLRVGL